PGFSTDAKRRPSILSIFAVSSASRRARSRRVFVSRDSFRNLTPASELVWRTGAPQNGWPQIRRAKAACPRRQFASEAGATAPSNRQGSKRKLHKPAEKANRD